MVGYEYNKRFNDAFEKTNRELDRVYNGAGFRSTLLVASLVFLTLVTFAVPDIYPFSMIQYGLFVTLTIYMDFKHTDKLADDVCRDWSIETDKIRNDFYKSLDGDLARKGVPK